MEKKPLQNVVDFFYFLIFFILIFIFIAIALKIFDTSVCYINSAKLSDSHFRVLDYDIANDFHHVFLFGDIDESSLHVEKYVFPSFYLFTPIHFFFFDVVGFHFIAILEQEVFFGEIYWILNLMQL